MTYSQEDIDVLIRLAGTRQFLADTAEESAAIREVGVATEETGAAMSRTSRRGLLMTQAMFTLRRMMYGVTLATIATGAVALKMGWSYNTAMQQATVALMPLQSATFNVRDELTKLFNFTKYTPFQFKDITTAFRQMYGAMSPLGVTSGQVNYYIHSIVDALSFAGRTTPGALNRVAVAMQHVAFLGRLTGQNVTQLARDGLPVYAALQKELGLTGEQVHNIGKLGIPAMVALNAISKYIETTPGYAGAAYRQATHSLTGIFTTFKDNLAQTVGTIESGFFHRLQNDFVNFNLFLDRITKQIHNGASLTDIVKSLSARYTPGSGGILMFYQDAIAIIHNLTTFVVGMTSALSHSTELWTLVFAALTAVRVASWFLAGSTQEIILLLKIILPLWVAYKGVTMAAAIATGLNTFANEIATVKLKDMTFAQFLAKLAIGDFAIMERIATGFTWAYVTAQTALTIATGKLRDIMIITNIVLMENPIILIVAAVIALTAGIIVLYFKWKWFHNEVNNLWHDLIYAAPAVAAALTLAFGPIGLAVTALLLFIRYWQQIKGQLHYVATGGLPRATPAQEAAAPHRSGWSNFWHQLLNVGHKGLPGMAMGGTVIAPGLTWVGERGPELLRLGAGAQVLPLSRSNEAFQPPESGSIRQPVVIPVYLGRKKLGQAQAEIAIDAMGRS